MTNEIETLDPRYATDALSLRATRLVHAGLIRLDPTTLAPLPYLAKEWQWENARQLKVVLRNDVRFHSGAQLTAHDVSETLKAFASPSIASRHARVVESIESVHENSSNEITITLRRPHATLLTDLELPILRADQAASTPQPSGTLDGLGPFVFSHSERGQWTFDPASNSPLPKAAHSFTLRTVRDENARALRLYAGRADIALNVISPQLFSALHGHDGLSVACRPGANLTYLVFRWDRAPFVDVNVRRSISNTINRASITNSLFNGHAQPAVTLLPPMHWAHTAPNATEHAHTSSQHVRISLLTSIDRFRLSVARVVAQQLRDSGVDVEVIPLEFGTLLARLNAGDFDMAMLQLPEFTEPNVLRVFLHSASIPPFGANRGRVNDPVIDSLLDEGDSEIEPAKRRSIYARLETRARDVLPIIPLWHEEQCTVTSARARAFTPSAEGRWLSFAEIR